MSAVLHWPDPNRRAKRIAATFLVGMLAVLVGAFAFVGAWLLMASAQPHWMTTSITCDRAIEAVMTSRDVIEIERGGVLINALGCDVRRRIGPDGQLKPRAQ